jgi:hypothetical protein
MTITSKYSAKCKKCGGFIAKGEKIEWSKEEGPRHVVCRPPERSTVLAHRLGGGGSKSQQAPAPGTAPYGGKFQRVAKLYNELEQKAATTRPRTTTTFHGKYTTMTA